MRAASWAAPMAFIENMSVMKAEERRRFNQIAGFTKNGFGAGRVWKGCI
jgi:hypothetical protein